MKLYDLPKGTKFTVVGDAWLSGNNKIYTFHHLDGMYSYCENEDGHVIHIAAWTDVEVVNA